MTRTRRRRKQQHPPKTMISMRLGAAAEASAVALQGVWAYASRTEAVEAALAALEASLEGASAGAESLLSPAEWGLLAEACAAEQQEAPQQGSGGPALAEAAASLAARTGAHCRRLLGVEAEACSPAQRSAADVRLRRLCDRLRAAPEAQARAVARALCWLYRHGGHEGQAGGPWWSASWRRQRLLAAAGEQRSADEDRAAEEVHDVG